MNERDWVPFHRRLARGPKKSIPRGVRFVLLELSLEARTTGGVLYFPPEWDTLSAVHDRIGGDRKEIRKALTVFQIPDSTGAQVLRIVRDEAEHRLEITKWESWAGPKSGSDRSQLSRTRATDRNDIAPLTISKTLQAVAPPLQSNSNATPTGQDRTGQDRREEEASPEHGTPRVDPTSEIRVRAAEPVLPDLSVPPEPSGDQVAIALAIRRHAVFRKLDAHGIASHAVTGMVGKGTRLAWVTQAIDDCAGKCVGLGLTAEALQSKLVGFMRHAKPPKADEREQKSGPAYREEQEDPAVIDRIRRMPKRVTAQDMPPPVSTDEQRARAMALVSGIGKGGS